jgi:prevent-host-death family protein
MKMITATEANRDFSRLLEQVEGGDVINITKHGRIVATLVPARDAVEQMEKAKAEHLAVLRARKPIPGLKRGTRDELYDDLFP